PWSFAEYCLKQRESCRCVVPEKGLRPHHRFTRLNQRGKMHYTIETASPRLRQPEEVFNSGPIGHFAFNKFDSGGNELPPAVREVVVQHGLVPVFLEQRRHCTTDIPCPSGNQYLHKKHCPFRNSFGNLESITMGSAGIHLQVSI